jgi:sensor domain CHASE-containing protein
MKTISKKEKEVRSFIMNTILLQTAMYFDMNTDELFWYQHKKNTNLYYVVKRQKNENGTYNVLCEKEFN